MSWKAYWGMVWNTSFTWSPVGINLFNSFPTVGSEASERGLENRSFVCWCFCCSFSFFLFLEPSEIILDQEGCVEFSNCHIVLNVTIVAILIDLRGRATLV